jgi:hypothetical protein
VITGRDHDAGDNPNLKREDHAFKPERWPEERYHFAVPRQSRFWTVCTWFLIVAAMASFSFFVERC